MNKKYEFTGETLNCLGRILHRIRALRDFGNVKAGDIGGWIEKEGNLSHEGNCWVYDEAEVYGAAVIEDEAVIRDKAVVGGRAVVGGSAVVGDSAVVEGSAVVRTTEDYIAIGPIGSRCGITTVFRTTDGVKIRCGCFYGSISEFEAKVKETHGDNQYAKEYLALAELLKIRFGE